MSTVQEDILALEERLRLAELGPDPEVFNQLLADNVQIIAEDGESVSKKKIVDAHQPGKGSKFTDVKITDMKIVDHGMTTIVTCNGTYKSAQGSKTLKFMRVWLRKSDQWQIVAGSIYNAP